MNSSLPGCGFQGTGCAIVETTLINGGVSSTDISLIDPYVCPLLILHYVPIDYLDTPSMSPPRSTTLGAAKDTALLVSLLLLSSYCLALTLFLPKGSNSGCPTTDAFHKTDDYEAQRQCTSDNVSGV